MATKRRVGLVVTEPLYLEVERLANARHTSMAEIFRSAVIDHYGLAANKPKNSTSA